MRVHLTLWAADAGGRHTPFFDGFRPSFRASTDGHGDVDLGPATFRTPADTPMVLPGTETDLELDPVDAGPWGQAAPGLVLGVFEGDRQIGTATVLES